MKNSIKRAQSQACLNFAERLRVGELCSGMQKIFRLKAKNKILMTLALLLTAVSGAWATDTYTITFSGFGNDACNTTITDATLPFSKSFTKSQVQEGAYDISTTNPTVESVDAWVEGDSFTIRINSAFEGTVTVGVNVTTVMDENFVQFHRDIIVTCVKNAAPIEVTPGSSANTWTFQMPASDVVLTPQYAPTAKWDVVEGVEQLPAAIEGIIAGQDAAIVTPGQSSQGTVMYAVTTTAEAAPALTAFSATVPTAKDYDDATTLYVWYYIQGADTPSDQQATEDNTFNDSEICATPLTVEILTNKFDIQFNAANDNTIEAGKATVTVDGTAATVTDGKLQGVKMGSEVKMTAKQGYKFRKVEVKKGGLLTLSVCGETIYYAKGETWAEAIQNHPTENQGWGLSGSGNVTHDNFGFLLLNDDFVPGTAKIDPNASYSYTGL